MMTPAFLPKGPVYADPEPDMLLRILDGSRGPGMIPLNIARRFSESAEAYLDQRLDYLEAVSIADERAIADSQAAITTEAKARADANTALSARMDAMKSAMVPMTATLALPASLTLLAGKSVRTISAPGVRKNDNLVVTPNAALPATVSMGEAYCLTDGTLSVVLVNSSALLTITAALSVPLGIIALRPTI